MLKQIPALVLVLLLQINYNSALACSMCKITVNGRSYLGNNEDNWRLGARIWFENATTGGLGALYLGFADGFPQGGMNEAGLAFDCLSVYAKEGKFDPSKKTVDDKNALVKGVLQHCKTVEEARLYLTAFNWPIQRGVVFFADPSGQYLIVEPDTMLLGNDDRYLISNFCPSSTAEEAKLKQVRYERGKQFLLNHSLDTNSNLCLATVDTMHVCRAKIGDGTLYSFVADLNARKLDLYFYHDYSFKKSFDLREELAKGNHFFEMPALFPPSEEYQKLEEFKTPHNDHSLLAVVVCAGGLFAFSAVFFLLAFFRQRKHAEESGGSRPWVPLALFALSSLLLYYMVALLLNQPIFYFPSPYHVEGFSVLKFAAYTPFLLLAFLLPSIVLNFKAFRQPGSKPFYLFLFAINNLAYLGMIGLFAYWGLYAVG